MGQKHYNLRLLAISFFSIIILFAGFYIFNYIGGAKIFDSYKMYRSSLAYLDSLGKEQKETEAKRFFGTEKKGLHGGILAAYGLLLFPW